MRKPCGAEVADILRHYGPAYTKKQPLPRNQLRAMHAIEVCRSAELGGHIDKCDACGHLEISYNSCRNRHCPKCQFLKKEKWIEDRSQDLLPIQYFHVVFTIPEKLNPLTLRNQGEVYNILFRAASETLIELGKDPRHIGAQIGFIGILHTWGQNLMDHPHIHCVVTGGGLSADKRNWVSGRKKFFIPVKVMSRLFRGKFLDYLRRTYEAGKMRFPGDVRPLQETGPFEEFLRELYAKEWVVYCKPPFNGADGVLKYLSRYTHRIAIGNHRIVKVQDGKVSFLWRDYSDGNKQKTMTLKVDEFIRRFLLHILPDRFVKIRHYGLLGSRSRKLNIDLSRKLLGVCKTRDAENTKETWQELLLRVSGIDVTKCPVCRKGRMHPADVLEPARGNRSP